MGTANGKVQVTDGFSTDPGTCKDCKHEWYVGLLRQ